MKLDTTIKPDIRIVPIDESEYWNEKSLKKAGKIANVYIFDANVGTHLCSLIPSYWLRYIDFITEKFIENDNDWEYIHDAIATSEQSNYYGRSILDAKYVTYSFNEDFPGYDDQELYDEWFNELVEYLQCNQSFFELDCLKILGWEIN
jgi:hypothetical protein